MNTMEMSDSYHLLYHCLEQIKDELNEFSLHQVGSAGESFGR